MLLAVVESLWGRIRTLVVYTNAEVAARVRPPRLGRGPGGELRPERVVLAEIEPEALLAMGPELFPLVPFTRTDRDRIRRGIVRWWREVRRSPGMSDEIADRLWTRFVSFLIARFDRDTLMEITHLIEGAAMSIEKTRAGQDLIAIGKKRGRRAGKREGKREGIRQGLVESILQALEVRFGAVPEDVPAALERFEDPEVLREILRLALSARDARRFRRGLAALGGGGC